MSYPTLLAALAAARHWTARDAVAEFGRTAERLNESYRPSERQWERWCAGEIKVGPRPLCCRVLEKMFGRPVAELFAPPPLIAQDSPWPDGYSAGTYWSRARFVPEPGSPMDEEIAVVADDSARFARRVRRVDEHALEQLDADVRQLAYDYLRRPPYFTFRRVADLRTEVFAMLDERHPLEQERRLYQVAGQLCGLLAHASADLGHPHEADTHARTALVCAELTDDNPLRTYVRWVQSNVAYWQGDYRKAAAIAHTGRDYAASGTALLRLASQEARALAATRDGSEFGRAIGDARDARDSASEADEPGVFRFSPGKAAYYASEAYFAMGSPGNIRQAQQQAQESIQLLANDPDDQGAELLAAARLDLVAAHLAGDDLDGAAEHLAPILSMSPEHRTMPVVQRVWKIGKQLTARPAAPAAVELRERIALFAAHPAATPEVLPALE
ncbi:hypothetical protein [Actinomadura gamaensis]|uniref:XRE family transcriptional regulator n=1 Tax=Actinomadura gamaensis TaxID=1763541 RepID=A0ABV9U7B3_9ACTN